MTDPAQPSADDEEAKIAFRPVRDEDGYPPADWEHLWAHTVGDGQYLIDFVPFFVYGISLGDLVQAEAESGYLVYQRTLKRSSHSTLRVMLFQQEDVEQLRQALADLGCATELSHLPGLLAVDVPSEVSYSLVQRLLQEGEEAGTWEYEAALRA